MLYSVITLQKDNDNHLAILETNENHISIIDFQSEEIITREIQNNGEECYRTFTRNLIDYAYAMIWEDDNHFVALLDNYRVVKVNIRGTEPIFSKRDHPA
ncbi:MAG: hypothetical protein AB8B65_04950 [Kordia sp.]|uniref:hypothetical protein n=1 Tax=Kordia sp. TaxID=1965332 RepID=UPI00385EE943